MYHTFENYFENVNQLQWKIISALIRSKTI